ncbi:helix-turn-helix domain-containing protein [Micromonospora sp. NPDC003776]
MFQIERMDGFVRPATAARRPGDRSFEPDRRPLSRGAPRTEAVARRAGISPAITSHHTTILREAGLITSQRHGNLVLHRPTAMGETLLGDV